MKINTNHLKTALEIVAPAMSNDPGRPNLCTVVAEYKQNTATFYAADGFVLAYTTLPIHNPEYTAPVIKVFDAKAVKKLIKLLPETGEIDPIDPELATDPHIYWSLPHIEGVKTIPPIDPQITTCQLYQFTESLAPLLAFTNKIKGPDLKIKFTIAENTLTMETHGFTDNHFNASAKFEVESNANLTTYLHPPLLAKMLKNITTSKRAGVPKILTIHTKEQYTPSVFHYGVTEQLWPTSWLIMPMYEGRLK